MTHNHSNHLTDISIATGEGIVLPGILGMPQGAQGIVIFAHGSGSSRFSSRNQYVARRLQSAGIATLLLDLLTPDEEAREQYTGHLRFNIELLADRLGAALEWVELDTRTRRLPVGLFGASTGGGAAMALAARKPAAVRAVVSRGGRPDLAGASLGLVQAPTLLIVGGDDRVVLGLNKEALHQMQCEKELLVVPHATHLFEEPGALDQVAAAASDWFARHLIPQAIPH